MENCPLIHCEQLHANNTKGELNLKAYAGNIISIIGSNHDSNTNWLKTIGAIIEAKSGRLYLTGKEPTQFNQEEWVRARTQFAYVHADTAILSAANALQNLMLPAMYHQTGDRDEIKNNAQELLHDIQAGENLELLPAYLKKEQRYKIAVARALMLKPQALLLDSPFTALELSSIDPFKQFLLNQVRDKNLLLILVTHDVKFALKYSNQILYISEQQMLQFDKSHRIQDCNDTEVRDYLSMLTG